MCHTVQYLPIYLPLYVPRQLLFTPYGNMNKSNVSIAWKQKHQIYTKNRPPCTVQTKKTTKIETKNIFRRSLYLNCVDLFFCCRIPAKIEWRSADNNTQHRILYLCRFMLIIFTRLTVQFIFYSYFNLDKFLSVVFGVFLSFYFHSNSLK